MYIGPESICAAIDPCMTDLARLFPYAVRTVAIALAHSPKPAIAYLAIALSYRLRARRAAPHRAEADREYCRHALVMAAAFAAEDLTR
jgi:hypothetical protein